VNPTTTRPSLSNLDWDPGSSASSAPAAGRPPRWYSMSEFPVQVTIKPPATVASAPWLNFQGQSVDEVKDHPGGVPRHRARQLRRAGGEGVSPSTARSSLRLWAWRPLPPLRRPRFRAVAPHPSGPVLSRQRPPQGLLRPSARTARRSTARATGPRAPGRLVLPEPQGHAGQAPFIR
jgi:hypothetical protein